jgi:hypothetical protein
LRDLGIEPPTADRLERVLASASSAFEERFAPRRRPVATRDIRTAGDLLRSATEGGETAEPEHSVLQQLKMDPGRAGLDNVVIRVASFLPFHATYYLNGHSFIEQESGDDV